MPEATVDEYCQVSLWKNDVCDAPRLRQKRHLYAIAKSSAMQRFAQN